MYSTSLLDGVLIMPRPIGYKGFTVTLDPETRAKFEAYCKKHRRSLNIQCVILIEKFLQEEDEKSRSDKK
jgi:hypothetical protein